MAGNDSARDSDAKCCGVVQEAAEKSRERSEQRRNKPHPWIVLKMTVGITLAIIGYASYVYIGRFCVPMIRHNTGPLSGRRTGIPFLVIFCILLVMTLWTYVMVVLISPGLARDYVQKTSPPVYESSAEVPQYHWESTSDLNAGQYRYVSEGHIESQHSQVEGSTLHSEARAVEKPGRQDVNVGVTNAISPIDAAHTHAQANTNAEGSDLPMRYTRNPPKTPILRPNYRYCYKDGFIKPPRAHHCRACGTCVLQYDHHCPWIGQCVGARNHKYFVHFLQWASLYCMWIFATLVAGAVNEGRDDDLDPQYIVIIALSALFTIFTVVLLITHIRLIVFNQSTVEHMQAMDMKEREQGKLSRMYAWYEFEAKRRTLKQWDKQWGHIETEGNLWWLGSFRENWISVMGHSKWGWFLPVGRTLIDGLHWVPNPRHDEEGRWRPRHEWPTALQ